MNRPLLVWGARGSEFESRHADHFSPKTTGYSRNAVARFFFVSLDLRGAHFQCAYRSLPWTNIT